MSNNPFSDVPPSNPYAVSTEVSANGDGYVKQIPIIGTLTIVQSILELLVGACVVGLGFFMEVMANNPKFVEEMQKSNMPPHFLTWLYVGIGIVVLIVGIMRLVSGIMIVRKRGRMFGIISAIVGLGTSFTCYCAPTAIGLAIYTLVVLIQPAVAAEFDRVKRSS
jgi:uncharacterized membrane protein HdeD (DUF308 family)